MKDYPARFINDADHLLFDIGFSSAIVHRSQAVLEAVLSLTADPALKSEIMDLLATMRLFQEGRLQLIDSIYKAAPEITAVSHN